LVLKTALHIGGGEGTLGATDSPVIRTVDGQPFIPGSSLKGAFRSLVEKLATTLELPNMSQDVLDANNPWLQAFNDRREQGAWDNAQTAERVEREWPVTSLLFGTPYTASRIRFKDAFLENAQEALVQRRDGVAIDRDSERAVDGLLYDYEVVPSSLQFGFELGLENPTDADLGLTCMGLAEMRDGFFQIGGKRSSGLGQCQLEDLQVYVLDLSSEDIAERAERLRRYLKGSNLDEKFECQDETEFLQQHIDALLTQT
jgi:CRISPR-associated RAMP protein (TIGR02581 family)